MCMEGGLTNLPEIARAQSRFLDAGPDIGYLRDRITQYGSEGEGGGVVGVYGREI
jgi:hypothetical protein